MQIEAIAEVGIDDAGRLFVRPCAGDFEHVHRAAMEVYWDRSTRRLSHPAPRNWLPAQWFKQIVAAVADEYGIQLRLTGETAWLNVAANIRSELEAIN